MGPFHRGFSLGMSAKKKAIREKFRNETFARDGHVCRIQGCTISDNLDAHHITDRNEMPGGGYVKENGITLCHEHHMMAEVYHSCGKELWEDGFHPNDLYELIGSSYEKAVEVSERKLL